VPETTNLTAFTLDTARCSLQSEDWELSGYVSTRRVPDLLEEVHEWTRFADRFTHARTSEPSVVEAMIAEPDDSISTADLVRAKILAEVH
jgi:hypothetical protein